MMKYVRLFREFFRACIVEEFEYRVSLAANVMSTLFWLGMSVLSVQLYFCRASDIGGWSFYEVLALVGVFNAIHGFIEFFLQPNMSRLVSHIRTGTLDFVLTKPVDSQFYISFRHLVFWRLADIVLGLGLTGFAVWRLGARPGVGGLAKFALLFLAAVSVVYALWMGMMILSFWAVKVDNLSHLFTSLFETARYPVTVYRGAVRLLFTYVFPVAFVTTVPTLAVIGRLGWTETLIALAVAALFLLLSRAMWTYALRHYTSAGS